MTEHKYYSDYMIKSIKRNNGQLTILGMNEQWKGFNWRFKKILEYLVTLNDDDIVCVIDGYDVICVQNLENFTKSFQTLKERENCKIIVGYDNLNHINFFSKMYVKLTFGTCKNSSINMGTYVGYAKDLVMIINDLLKINDNDNEDDQVLFTKFCKNNSKDIYIDTKNELFLSISGCMNEIDKFIDINDGVVSYQKNFPYFLHAPGATYLENVLKKLNYDVPNDDIKNSLKYKYISPYFFYLFYFLIIFDLILFFTL